MTRLLSAADARGSDGKGVVLEDHVRYDRKMGVCQEGCSVDSHGRDSSRQRTDTAEAALHGSGSASTGALNLMLSPSDKLMKSMPDMFEETAEEKQRRRRNELRAADGFDDSDQKRERPPSRRWHSVRMSLDVALDRISGARKMGQKDSSPLAVCNEETTEGGCSDDRRLCPTSHGAREDFASV